MRQQNQHKINKKASQNLRLLKTLIPQSVITPAYRRRLSATATDQETCLDALEEANANFTDEIKLLMKNSTEFASNSLAIATKIVAVVGDFKIPALHRRRLLGFPAWVKAGDRRLLQEIRPTPNVTVATDGSGDVKSVAEAVAMVPKKSATRFVIYVKAGEYVEHIDIGSVPASSSVSAKLGRQIHFLPTFGP